MDIESDLEKENTDKVHFGFNKMALLSKKDTRWSVKPILLYSMNDLLMTIVVIPNGERKESHNHKISRRSCFALSK